LERLSSTSLVSPTLFFYFFHAFSLGELKLNTRVYFILIFEQKGNDIFNRSMRLLANRKGFSLNQRALSKDVARDKQTRLKVTAGKSSCSPPSRLSDSSPLTFSSLKRVFAGTVVASRTEEEIFAALGVTWRPPNERIC